MTTLLCSLGKSQITSHSLTVDGDDGEETVARSGEFKGPNVSLDSSPLMMDYRSLAIKYVFPS